ncbi:gamma-glutamylcyclotransferase [Microvirga sp. BT291]|nr:gamma-glutamylcyclotransferase [Microvirga pudoricolor]
MPLYFAYGSNMDRVAMAQRCPSSRAIGPARLMRHRFIVTVDGYASVGRDPAHAVWGLLWDLALADIPALDRYESLSTGLYSKVVQPVLTQQGARRALVYLGRTAKVGAPKAGYMEGVLAAAMEAGLPAEYLRELGQWKPQGRSPGPGPDLPEGQPGRPAVRPRWSAPAGGIRRPSEI